MQISRPESRARWNHYGAINTGQPFLTRHYGKGRLFEYSPTNAPVKKRKKKKHSCIFSAVSAGDSSFLCTCSINWLSTSWLGICVAWPVRIPYANKDRVLRLIGPQLVFPYFRFQNKHPVNENDAAVDVATPGQERSGRLGFISRQMGARGRFKPRKNASRRRPRRPASTDGDTHGQAPSLKVITCRRRHWY